MVSTHCGSENFEPNHCSFCWGKFSVNFMKVQLRMLARNVCNNTILRTIIWDKGTLTFAIGRPIGIYVRCFVVTRRSVSFSNGTYFQSRRWITCSSFTPCCWQLKLWKSISEVRQEGAVNPMLTHDLKVAQKDSGGAHVRDLLSFLTHVVRAGANNY